MSDLFDLTGKVALITGGSGGISRAIAQAMGRHGAAVVLSGNDPAACRSACLDLQAHGIDALGLPRDVSSREETERLVADTLAERGRIVHRIYRPYLKAF